MYISESGRNGSAHNFAIVLHIYDIEVRRSRDRSDMTEVLYFEGLPTFCVNMSYHLAIYGQNSGVAQCRVTG